MSAPRVLGLIPARGGSKGVPRKNIRVVGGEPLIAYTIRAARASARLSAVVVSTDDAEIAAVAREHGAQVLERPAELAGDESPGVAPVLHALDVMPGYDYLVLLQPTSPLRVADDIDACVERCLAGAPACVSVCEAEQSPYWMYRLSEIGALHPLMTLPDGLIPRRQDLPPVYALNGAVYVAKTDWLRTHETFLSEGVVGYVMPQERSLDIDTELDLRIFAAILGSEP